MSRSRFVIRASVLFDGQGASEDQTVVLEGDRIAEVGRSSAAADIEVIVTPGFIDGHSHIGMARSGEPAAEEETNETCEHILPLADPLNSVYFDDPAFTEAVDFGVLYSCLVPGSGNVLGGKAVIIRNFASGRGDALVKDYGFKLALGYNPRSTGGWKGVRPNSRMGVYALLEKRLEDLLRRRERAALARERKLRELSFKAGEKGLPPR